MRGHEKVVSMLLATQDAALVGARVAVVDSAGAPQAVSEEKAAGTLMRWRRQSQGNGQEACRGERGGSEDLPHEINSKRGRI